MPASAPPTPKNNSNAVTVLYDGWALVHQPNSPAALHLLALMARLPKEVDPIVALPGEAPVWFSEGASLELRPCRDEPRSRLRWEQWELPKMGRELGAHLLHLVSPQPPLFGTTPTALSPTGLEEQESPPSGFIPRLREALGRGARRRVGALLWAADLPSPKVNTSVMRLPPLVHPAFSGEIDAPRIAPLEVELPETYVLYHGPSNQRALLRLLEVWSWTSAPLGDSYPLVCLGLDSAAQNWLGAFLERHDLEISVRPLPAVSPTSMAQIYRGCSALLHPEAGACWSGTLRHALACARPVVAAESDSTDALVGPGAYLTPAEDSRAMGAALLTVIVNNEMSTRLSRAAGQRGAAWNITNFGSALLRAYRKILSSEGS